MLSPDWPKDLMDSLLEADATVDVYAWFPFRDSRLTPYYITPFAEKLYEACNRIRSSGYSPKQTVAHLAHVTHFRDEIDNLLAYWSHGDLKISRLELSTLCKFLVDVLDAACWADPFSKKGDLLLLRPEQVLKLEDSSRWIEPTHVLAKKVGILISTLNNLAYALYTDVWANAAGDFAHGPYNLSASRRLIVRDYTDVAPNELWPHSAEWNVRKVRILTSYKPEVDLKIDFYGTLVSESNLVQGLSSFAIEVNGEQLPPGGLDTIILQTSTRAVEQNRTLRSLEFERLKRKFLEAHCYTERDLFGFAGLDWRPTQLMYGAIAGKELLPGAEDWGDDRELYRKALDAVVSP
jgi:hypothetical protein